MKKIMLILALTTILFSEICDFNNDESLNVLDIVIMVESILNGGEEYCDLNGDNLLNVIDVVQLVNLVLYGTDIEFVEIPAGDFNSPGSNEPSSIGYDFKIGKYEVTNQQYLRYLNSAIDENQIWVGDCINNIGEICVNGNYEIDSQVIEKSFFVLGNPNLHMLWEYDFGEINIINNEFVINNALYIDHPVVHVTWYGASHFAEYYGYRLPTYDEWIKAARSDTNWNWPWSNSGGDMQLKINVLNSQFNVPDDFTYPWDNGTTPVGFYKEQNGMIDNASPFGVYDMIGNVSEWVSDSISFNQDMKLSLGGGWDWGLYNSRLKWHSIYTLGESNWSSGFRVVQHN